MKAITFCKDFETCAIRLSGAKGKYKIDCDFGPFLQKDFLNKIEEIFDVQRVISENQNGEMKGTILFHSQKEEQDIVNSIDYIYQRYTKSGL